MPYTPPAVSYSSTLNGTYTQLTGVQTVNIRRGRAFFQDNFPATRCTIELIPANSYATPLAIGQFIDVRTTNNRSAAAYFVGQITDVERSYDMPYTAATGYAPGDRITITATGSTGQISATTVPTWTATVPGSAIYTAYEIALQANAYVVTTGSDVGTNITTLTNVGVLDVINQLCRTLQFNMDDVDTNRQGNWYNSDALQPVLFIYSGAGSLVATFGDAGSGTKYNQLRFLSSNQSTFNSVNVITSGLATQNTKAATGPYNSLDYNTYSANTSNAANLATYLYRMLSGQVTVAPFTIACDTAVDDSFLQYCHVSNSYRFGETPRYTWIGGQATIAFRGTTYGAAVQSINTNFYPDRATAEFTFAPTLGQPFTLDSSSFGKLNTNRLGYP